MRLRADTDPPTLCWSSSRPCDYAECVDTNPLPRRRFRGVLGIIRCSALWVLSRDRDNTHRTTDRLRTSRSIRNSATSERSRFNSAMSPVESPCGPSRSARSLATQLPRVPPLIPRSRATWAIGFPGSRTIRTAPSRNSWSNFLRFSDMPIPHSACLHALGGYPIRWRAWWHRRSCRLLPAALALALRTRLRRCARLGGASPGEQPLGCRFVISRDSLPLPLLLGARPLLLGQPGHRHGTAPEPSLAKFETRWPPT